MMPNFWLCGVSVRLPESMKSLSLRTVFRTCRLYSFATIDVPFFSDQTH